MKREAMAPAPAAAAGAGETADAGNAPFWSGSPDAEEFGRRHAARLERARRAIAALIAVTGPRTIENTLQPYDDALLELDAAGSQASLMENVHPDGALRAAAEAVTQQAAALSTELSLNRPVYDALASLDLAGVDPATRHYVERTLRDFRLSGVDRDDATRARVQRLNDELVAIGQEFSRNIRADQRTVPVGDPGELEGLPADYVARHPPGADGAITLSIDYPDSTPVFLYAARDDLRRRMYMEVNNRAFPANVGVLERLIAKRDELATLLGFAHWADYVTANKMVGSAAAADAFITRIVAASAASAAADHEALLRRRRADAPGATGLQAWEAAYYAEQVRKSDYDLDARELRPYLAFARVQQGVLDLCARLFGVTFRRRDDAPVWHPSVECWEMIEEGRVAGRFYLDMHPRPDKYTHAAQFDIRTGVAGRQIPEAALICNFPGGSPGDPGLMEHADVRTLFHEFGHLLHNLFARQRWIGIGGIRPEADFIEVPSQLLEEWVWDPEVLGTFARHVETGAPIPAELVRRLKRASEFGKGLQMRRQMVFAHFSLSAFDRPPAGLDLDALLRDYTERYVPFPFVDGTHFVCGFGHLDGYSALYYSYMWSLVIAKDFFEAFDRARLMDPGVARRYREAVLEPGGSMPAAAMVERFLGRPFRFDAFERWLNERP
ncbi:MAG TPA: M3 family metallopeptidase [Candidatus Eisenbacteria bacterium]